MTTAAAATVLGTSAQAIVVTATFEGSVTEQVGFPDVINAPVTVTIAGDPDAGTVPSIGRVIDSSLGGAIDALGSISGGSFQAYFLTELRFSVLGEGIDVAAVDPVIEVYDNVMSTAGPGTFDAVLAKGTVPGGDLVFASVLPADTFSGTGLAQGTTSGLLSSQFEAQGAELSLLPSECATSDALCSILSDDLRLTGFSETTTDNGSPMAGAGITGGFDGKDMAPVPLPASALLLLAGLTGLAATRRRRG
ncbi:MAG: VPLPA-CTERM sorting domain-containing protein [Pseudomonadota bacterium]